MNDDKCKWISEQSTPCMEQLWNSEEAQEDEYDVAIQGYLIERYIKQFGALSDKFTDYTRMK